MPLDFYTQLQQQLQQGSIVLATVIHSKGSVPREVGAKMIVGADGHIVQTIGGGAGEAKVIRQAITLLETGEKQLVEIDLTGDLADASQRETQGICGGWMQVWLERWSGETSIALVQQILDRLQSGQSVTLVTPFQSSQFPYLLDNPLLGDQLLGDQVLGNPFGLEQDGFVETIQPPPVLLIVGAGHVGVQLAKVADRIGFQVVVQDDRPDWANSQHYPQASLILSEPIATALAQLSTHRQLYAALVTRGYSYDLAALNALLQRSVPCVYIGMIGSKKRVRQVLQAIDQTGSEDQRPRIHAPIGLDIGAFTPAEIAVSIGAELILVRRGGTGRPLSEKFHLRS